MNHSTNKPAILSKLLKLTVIAALIGFGLNSLVLSPIYIRLASDVAFSDTLWVALLYHLTQDGLLDLAVFAVCYPASMYAVWRVGLRRAKAFPVAFSLLTLGKYVVNYFMTCLTDTGFPSAMELFTYDLPVILFMLVLELGQYAAILAILMLTKSAYLRRKSLEEAETMLAEGHTPDGAWDTDGDSLDATCGGTEVFPFTRLVSLRNPVQLTAFLGALLVFLARSINHLIYQITLFRFYGFTDGLLVMGVDFITDLFLAVLFYFASVLLLPRFARQEQEN